MPQATNQPANQTVDPAAGSNQPGGKNPLDVLEELLKNAQQDKAATGGKPQAQASDSAPLPNLPNDTALSELAGDMLGQEASLAGAADTSNNSASSAEETDPGPSEEEILAAIELKKQEAKQVDQQAAQIQLQAVRQEAVNSPQAKAKIHQEQEAEKIQKQENQQSQDYAIHQLGHTKI